MRTLKTVPSFKQRTITRDLTLALVLMNALVIAVFGITYQIYYTGKEIADLKVEAAGVANEFASVLSRPLWNLDTETVTQIARAYLSSDFISGVRITTGTTVLLNTLEKTETGGTGWQLARDVVYSDETIGSVTLSFSQSRIDTTRRQSMGLTLLTLVLVTLVIGFGSRQLMKYLLARPLHRLTAAIRSIADGNYQQTIPSETWADINLLVDEINRMAREIDSRETDLKRLRGMLKNIIDSMPSVLVGVDPDGQVIQWNREAEVTTGIHAETAMGHHLTQVFPELAETMTMVEQTIREKHPHKESKVLRQVGGQARFFDITVYPLLTRPSGGAVIRIDDVTDRVRIEEMMIQSEKMLSVGGLAAGMAHEINNPLAGIMQNVQVVRNRLLEDLKKNRETADRLGIRMTDIQNYMSQRNIPTMIEAIMVAGRRAAKIVENMLSFSRKSESSKTLSNLAELMDTTIELAENDYDLKKHYDFRRIEVVREYDPQAPPVPCETTKIQQVFLNILKNGAQAMAETSALRPPRFTIRIKPQAEMVRVEIVDSGPGMKESIRKRIFEPFFTTKPVGIGTGLGLSVSYFIITENHGGTMAVQSAPDAGCCFVIHLPMGDAPGAGS